MDVNSIQIKYATRYKSMGAQSNRIYSGKYIFLREILVVVLCVSVMYGS